MAGILTLRMMNVTWTGKYNVFHFVINKQINEIKIRFYVTESLLYHSIIPTTKSMKSNICMYTRKLAMLHRIFVILGHIRKTNSNIKSSFMHNLLNIVILFIVCKCLLIPSPLKCRNKLGGCPFNGPLSGMKYPTRTKSTTRRCIVVRSRSRSCGGGDPA